MKNTKRIFAAFIIAAILISCCTVALAMGPWKYVTTGKCYLRSEPDKSSEKLATIPKGKTLKVTDWADDDRGVTWCLTKYKGKTGWVSTRNLEYAQDGDETPKPTHKPTAKPTPKPIDWTSFRLAGYNVQVTSSTLNMRFNPSSDSDVIGVYDCGDVLYAKRTNGSWYEVIDEYTNKLGYMSAKYLVVYQEPTATTVNGISVRISGAQSTSENPWGFTAGIINSKNYGECIFLTPKTSVIFDDPTAANVCNLSVKIYDKVAANSDGAGITIRIAGKNGQQVKKIEMDVSAEADWVDIPITSADIAGAESVTLLCNNGFNGDDTCDWVIIRNNT